LPGKADCVTGAADGFDAAGAGAHAAITSVAASAAVT
jgi:hypothetical protein